MNAIPTFARLGAAVSLALCALAAQAHQLTVEVINTRGDAGNVSGALFDSEASWLKQPLQGQRGAVAEKTVLVYRDLQAGTYALSLFQDENGNGKLDRNVAGTPTERYGFSRDALGPMGPPAFSAAAFELNGDLTVTITLR